ncbi:MULTISPECIES: hypothetical protein [unclassified Bradyrhizobium]|uniref:hypothetical protein n=1 Tax=unclassified Bradyrhizobium TaxID=2631580 RepID=UPI0029170081|nr:MULTISPECIES: hypothetical protein [unclassified Bradyrhizobium]
MDFLKMLGLPDTLWGDGRPNNSLSDMQALTDAYKQARMAKANAPFGSGAQPVPYMGIGGLPAAMAPRSVPAAPQAAPTAPAAPMPMPRPAAAPQAPMNIQSQAQMQGVSAPAVTSFNGQQPAHQGLINRIGAALQGHPDPNGLIGMISHGLQGNGSAPQPAQQGGISPMSGFFQRNAAMMRDPSTGALIDPAGAAAAPRGPDLINKMMGYLHGKSFGDIGNNNDPSTWGSG